MTKKNIENLISILGRMKDLRRSGWLKRTVDTPESDADHSYSVALLSWLLAPRNLDLCRCLKLALIHDLAEIYSGDYTPVDNISPQEKHCLEQEAVQRLAAELNTPELLELFNEYETKQTKESLFVNGLDKLDNVLTAAWYDKNNRAPQKLLPEFSAHAARCLNALPEKEVAAIKQILNDILNERKKYE